MSERKCVELTAVYADGTVEHCAGPGLDEWWREANDHNGEAGPWEGIIETATHPLRRVTTLHGPYIGPDCECAACIKTSPGNYSGLEDLIPDGVPDQQFHGVDERRPWSWRIVVEAMPVEGGKS